MFKTHAAGWRHQAKSKPGPAPLAAPADGRIGADPVDEAVHLGAGAHRRLYFGHGVSMQHTALTCPWTMHEAHATACSVLDAIASTPIHCSNDARKAGCDSVRHRQCVWMVVLCLMRRPGGQKERG